MYQPHEFRDDDPATAYAHIARHPMGVIICRAGDRLRATHLPFLLDSSADPGGLISHFAMRNEHLAALPDGSDVLVVFPGAHAYVTPTLYHAEPDVPTWNYTAVHLTGTYRRLPDDVLPGLLTRTVDEFEKSKAEPFSLSSMDMGLLRSLARAVVPFTVKTVSIEGGYKLSQDKLQGDVDSVVSAFERSVSPDERAVAEEMRIHGVQGRTGPPSTDPDSWM